MATAISGLSEANSAQKRTLIAAALGWGLDGFDVLLYSNVQIYVMAALGIARKDIAGLPNTFMLLASGIGGVLFGFIADRIGRTKALMLSILTYSVCSLGSGLATSIYVLIAIRFVLGLGVGPGFGSTGDVDCSGPAAPKLADGLCCGYHSGARHAVDQEERARIGDVETASRTASATCAIL